MPLSNSPKKKPKFVEVIRNEEKGSDVNLATHMLIDAVRRDYELAALVTNDSDLLEPIRFVRNDLGLKVGLLNPQTRASSILTPEVDFIKQIRKGVLKASQFPDGLSDDVGRFQKPKKW